MGQKSGDQPKGTLALFLANVGREDAEWPKEELFNVVHWCKVVVALLAGTLFGVWPVTGWVAFVAFFLLYYISTLVFMRSILKIDDELYGGAMELVHDNLQVALATFLLFWLVTYNVFQQ